MITKQAWEYWNEAFRDGVVHMTVNLKNSEDFLKRFNDDWDSIFSEPQPVPTKDKTNGLP